MNRFQAKFKVSVKLAKARRGNTKSSRSHFDISLQFDQNLVKLWHTIQLVLSCKSDAIKLELISGTVSWLVGVLEAIDLPFC